MSETPKRTDSAGGDDAQRFGQFSVLRHIGHGGMAQVDLVRQEGPRGVSKLVALKTIRPQFLDNPMYVQMFLDEARIAASLQHPNIIQLHDVGMLGEQPYIAMEYLRGKDLAEILVEATDRNSHLPLDFVVGVICDVCAGLHHAHMMRTWEGQPLSIVHRDVSPDNIFITYEGNVKVMDFGLAKSRGRAHETQVGMIKGTVGYMAPEQMKGTEIDRRLDVFAAGVVLWELVTGHRLLESSDTRHAWEELMKKPIPSPSKYRPECSVALEAIIRRALNKDPRQRYQSAEAFLLDLERVAAQQGLWLSATRRASVMDALFPGRRNRALHDVTVVRDRPEPLALPKPQQQTPLTLQTRRILNIVQERPAAMLIALAVMVVVALTSVTVALVVSGSDESTTVVAPGELIDEPPAPTRPAKRNRSKKKSNRRKK